MTGFAYPEMMAQVISAFQSGNLDQARDIFDAYMPMIRYEAQPGLGLAIRKYTLFFSNIILNTPTTPTSPYTVCRMRTENCHSAISPRIC